MLACDLILEIRASRSISRDQVARLDMMVFGAGEPDMDGLELISTIDAYALRADASWAGVRARAAAAMAGRAGTSIPATVRPLAA